MTVQRLKLAGVVIAGFAFLAAAPGVALAASKCTSKEVKATGKKASCKAAVFAKAAAKGLPADSAKLTACETKFSTAFTKAMGANDCNPGGASESTIETKVDAFVNDLNSEIAVGPLPSKCQAAKLKAAGKKASCVLGVDAKGIAKDLPPDSAKHAACGTKMSASFTKAETKTDCGAAPGDSTIETKVDNFEADVLSEENPAGATTTTTMGGSSTTTTIAGCAPIVIGQPIAGTYVLNGTTGDFRCTTNSSTNRFGTCTDDAQCGGTAGMHMMCLQLPWVTADSQVMPFPSTVQTVFTVGAAGSFPTCEHGVCVPCGNPNASCAGIPGCEVAGNPNGCIPRGTQGCCNQPGFLVPTFFVNILGGLCSRVDQINCGLGVVNTSNPQTGDNEVTKNADTSDPGADCCYNGHPASECLGGTNLNDDPTLAAQGGCTPAGAGNDYKGKIVSTIGNGSPDANGIHYRLTTPELSTTWFDLQSPPGTCANGSTYDANEGLVSQIVLQAQPTTAGATGAFVDMNGDGCRRAGSGFIAPTNAETDGPITVGPSPGPLKPQPYNGSAGAVSAAVSEVFSGPGSPIHDIGFVAITPQQPIATHSAVSCSCTPTPGCPE